MAVATSLPDAVFLVLLAVTTLVFPLPLGAGEPEHAEEGGPSPAPPAETEATDEPAPSPPLSRLIGGALGWQAPLGSPGKSVPIWAVLAWGDELPGRDTQLRFNVQTTTVSGLFETPVHPPFFAGVKATTVVVSGQCSPYRYHRGERQKVLEIDSTCYGAGAFAGIEVSESIDLLLFAEAHRIHYMRNPETGSGLVKPPDHVEGFFGVEGRADRTRRFLDWQIVTGWNGSFRAEYFVRDLWRAWGPPGLPQTRPSAHREGARLSASWGMGFRLLGNHNLRLAAEGGVAWDVDALSAFRAGSLVGSPALPGYYYGEIICDRYLYLEARYASDLWKGGRGLAGIRCGGHREIDSGPWRGAFSFFVGLTQKIFFGIPLTVQYGYSPTADRKSLGGGHEVSVMVVA
ncbi:MAG: BamA/TamA family outer membrane protein, partial [Planctomycetota bacterium]